MPTRTFAVTRQTTSAAATSIGDRHHRLCDYILFTSGLGMAESADCPARRDRQQSNGPGNRPLKGSPQASSEGMATSSMPRQKGVLPSAAPRAPSFPSPWADVKEVARSSGVSRLSGRQQTLSRLGVVTYANVWRATTVLGVSYYKSAGTDGASRSRDDSASVVATHARRHGEDTALCRGQRPPRVLRAAGARTRRSWPWARRGSSWISV
jgi:hypothetical protein